MSLQQTTGNVTTDAYGGAGAALVPTYVEDVFSTDLYFGTAAPQSINNGIDLGVKGGLVWLKARSGDAVVGDNNLFDTTRGANSRLVTNVPGPADSLATLTGFSNTGFNLGSSVYYGQSGKLYVSYTFRKQPKFFDIVTWAGDGANSRQIFHSLNAVPGAIIVKNTTNSAEWRVYHASRTAGDRNLILNTTVAEAAYGNAAINDATSTWFRVDNTLPLNQSGNIYIAYVFANQAGGFGLSGTDSVIATGSFTSVGAGSRATITLGWEPQWILTKQQNNTGDWYITDTMRGMDLNGVTFLSPNITNGETIYGGAYIQPTANGFTASQNGSNGDTIIYIAIRRGPMKKPTSATQVYSQFNTAPSTGTQQTTGFPVDMQLSSTRAGPNVKYFIDRMRGVTTTFTEKTTPWMNPGGVALEQTTTGFSRHWNNTGYEMTSTWGLVQRSYYNFRRAPGFFDVVGWTGTGIARSQPHNLGTTPELIIIKRRDAGGAWFIGTQFGATKYTQFGDFANTAAVGSAVQQADYSSSTGGNFNLGLGPNPPNASNIVLDGTTTTNGGGATYIAYLFASIPGICKIGTYIHNGATDQTIDCGFTVDGARFVLIKKIDSTGNWFLFDTARGYWATSDSVFTLGGTEADTALAGDYLGYASNGFVAKPFTSVGNAATYFFMAIA